MAGYNPASNQTSNLPQSRVIFYDKKFIENLSKKLGLSLINLTISVKGFTILKQRRRKVL